MHDEKKNQIYLEKYLEERKKQPSRLLRNVIILAVIVIFKICFLMSFQLYIMYLYCYFKQKEMNKNFKSFSRVSSIRNGKKKCLRMAYKAFFQSLGPALALAFNFPLSSSEIVFLLCQVDSILDFQAFALHVLFILWGNTSSHTLSISGLLVPL